MKIAVSIILGLLSFVAMLLMGMDIDERKTPIPKLLLGYFVVGAFVCGIVLGLVIEVNA